jgi:hypothetical protein
LLTSSEYQRAIGRDVDGHDRLLVKIDTSDAAKEFVWHHGWAGEEEERRGSVLTGLFYCSALSLTARRLFQTITSGLGNR